MDARLSEFAARVTPAVGVSAMRCGAPFQAGKFYLMRAGVRAGREARLAGPFDTAGEAAESREVIGVSRTVVCRERVITVHRVEVAKVFREERWEASCACGWQSAGTFPSYAQADAEGEKHATRATREDAEGEDGGVLQASNDLLAAVERFEREPDEFLIGVRVVEMTDRARRGTVESRHDAEYPLWPVGVRFDDGKYEPCSPTELRLVQAVIA
jgi:hypothetical protein